ncbi:MAG: hypothetical protein IH957_00995 [Chloroflexi bacterium]|nr:hypothetical protein [Chloroflexota bacterium]
MSNEVIVLVSDLDDAGHGELKTFGNQDEAARLIESLLESGFDTKRIRAFHATRIEMKVSHRPVVALVGGELSSAVESEPEPTVEEVIEASDPERELVAVGATAKAEIRREVAPEPFVRDGVRFSSLFRPA